MLPSPRSPGTFRFGDFELDVPAYELRCQGNSVRLERRPMDLLVLLVERRGQLVSRSDIVDQLWGNDVFVDVGTGVNTVVWKVRRALCDSSGTPMFVETVSGRGYRFIAPVEIVSTLPVSPETPSAGSQSSSQRPATMTIVVLPFHNLSGDAEQEYFSDGLTDDTISALAQLNLAHFRVVARTSSMAYKRTTKTAGQIGRELRADYLLESSVRREGHRVRIATRLIRVVDEIQVWSETYNRTPDSLLGVQDEIGHAIASQVHGKVSVRQQEPLPRRPTPEAYDLYLRGKYHEHRFAIPDAIASFEAAVESDPSYALAYAGLAYTYALIPISGDAEPLEYLEKSRRALTKALELDPQLAEGHAAAGWIDFFLGWNWPRAEQALRRAIELNPNYALARFLLAHVLSNSFRHDEAIGMILHARDLDPFSALLHSFHGQFLFDARRYPEALKPIQRAIAIDPRFFHGHEILSRVHLQLGDLEPALEECEKSYQLSGGMLFAFARKGYVLARMGRAVEAQQVLATLRTVSTERFVAPLNFALVHAGFGDREATLDCLEQAVDVRAVQLVLLPTDPVWDEFRDEPRFRGLIRKAGFREMVDSAPIL